jgi:hypothetical protein
MHSLRFVLIVRVFAWILMLVFVTLFLLSLTLPRQTKQIYAIARILWPSSQCTSFDAWCQVIQKQTFLTFADHSSLDVERVSGPHIILCNHVHSYFGIGSLITIAGIMRSPSHIVCYKRYPKMSLGVDAVMQKILQPEIRIDTRWGPSEKEARMVKGIRETLDSGRNVVMFVDSRDYTRPMRSLTHKVLDYFPTVQKQLIQILDPSPAGEFRFRYLPATTCLATIVSMRESILVSDPLI